jgi:type I restriction enzyme S subunit
VTIPLGRLVEVNPRVPEFLRDPSAEVTFMPLETVWPDGHADVSRRATAASVASGYTQFRKGDVLLPKITPTFEAGRVMVADIPTPVGAGTTELHVLRPRGGVDARFIAYVGRSQPFLQEGATTLQGVGNLRRVPPQWIEKFPVHVADIAEQRAIPDFLDRETAQIDTLIAKQQRLIATLRERRSVVATELVTQGLQRRSGNAQISAQSWLDGMPSHWRVVTPKALFRDRRERGRADDVHLTPSQTYGVLPQTEYVARSGASVVLNLAGQDNMKHVEPGDFVIHLRSFQGGIEYSAHRGKVSAAYTVLEPVECINHRYFRALLKSDAYIQELRTTTNQLRDGQSIRYRDFVKVALPLPPTDEQERIGHEVESQTKRIDTLIQKSERLIELSQERRAALITAAVTGQIDVRKAA